jgi:sialate O-acetylesterase
MSNWYKSLPVFFLSFFLYCGLQAQLRLPAFLSDNMVLQQQKYNRIWGWAEPGKQVQVEFQGKTYPAFADKQGAWQVFLQPSSAGVGGTMRIRSGSETLLLDNILIGEVWVCSGQSNMEWRMNWLGDTYKSEMESAFNDQIRFVVFERAYSNYPLQDAKIERPWSAINPASIPECSAIAYWYAKYLQQTLNVPIGLVVTSWGGTPAESWTSFEGLQPFQNYTETYIQKIQPVDLQGIATQQEQSRQRYQQALAEKKAYLANAMQPDFDDSSWDTVSLPRPWEQHGFANSDGIMAYRIAFEVGPSFSGKPVTLRLPAIDDMDSTFLNGQFIGTTNRWNTPRAYSVPAGLLKKGRNILAIRVQDNAGGGGLAAAPEQFSLSVGGKTMPLAGTARFEMIAPLEIVSAVNGAMQVQPAVLYNAMIAPLLPLSIRGAIWYQGESNANRALEYRALFPAMIQDWRNRWGQGNFPFLYVQLSSYGKVLNEPAPSDWALLREAQALTRSILPNTAMVTTTDVGNPLDIHPKQKKEVGDRLAAEALRMVYGQQNLVSRGPQLKSYIVEGNKAILDFHFTGKGLVSQNGPPAHFALAGSDQKFYWAKAEIVGNQIVLTCDQVPSPVAVRYAWADSPVSANLFNREGFPAEPFRTDEW